MHGPIHCQQKAHPEKQARGVRVRHRAGQAPEVLSAHGKRVPPQIASNEANDSSGRREGDADERPVPAPEPRRLPDHRCGRDEAHDAGTHRLEAPGNAVETSGNEPPHCKEENDDLFSSDRMPVRGEEVADRQQAQGPDEDNRAVGREEPPSCHKGKGELHTEPSQKQRAECMDARVPLCANVGSRRHHRRRLLPRNSSPLGVLVQPRRSHLGVRAASATMACPKWRIDRSSPRVQLDRYCS